MSENKPPEESIADELRNLGKSLAETLQAAWESPERRKLQQEIEAGLLEMRSTLKREVDNFSQSSTGQRIKTDVNGVQQRIRTGEMEEKVRSEMINALRLANAELQKVATHLARRGQPEQTAEAGGLNPEKHEEVHPDDVDSGTPPQSSQGG
jgi:hypothetical protein